MPIINNPKGKKYIPNQNYGVRIRLNLRNAALAGGNQTEQSKQSDECHDNADEIDLSLQG